MSYMSDKQIQETMDKLGNPFDVKDFSTSGIAHIEHGIQKGYTKEQLSLLADPRYNYKQLNMIENCIEKGMPMEQVKVFANPGVKAEYMRYHIGKEKRKESFGYKLTSFGPINKAVKKGFEKFNDSVYARLYGGLTFLQLTREGS